MKNWTQEERENLHALLEIEDGIAEAMRAFRKRKEQLYETEQGSRIKYVNELLRTLRELTAQNMGDYVRSVEQKHGTNKQGAEND